jgi:DUF4097 and DUF4098 domain-containing protein YvlB
MDTSVREETVRNGRRHGGSIFAGLLLVLLGVIFLIDIYYPEMRLGHLIAVYWPVLLIVWGVVKILEYAFARSSGRPRPAIVSGGEAALIVVLVVVLGGFVIRDWARDRIAQFNFDVPQFGPSYTRSETLPPQTLPAGAQLAVEVPRGDISVQGIAGDQLLVSAQKKAWGMSAGSADRAMQQTNLKADYFGGLYRVRLASGFEGSHRTSADLNVQAPASANIAASTTHGDIQIAGISGSAQVHTGDGDIEVRNAGSDVNVNLVRGDARISGAAGSVRITGHGDDVKISDVRGNASVDGPFSGSIRMNNVAQTVQCALPWSKITVEQLNGTLETDLGDLSITGASGPLKVLTHNTDINVKDVTGLIDIADAHGDIKVALSAPPRQDIHITDDSGDVDVTLPANSSFEVAAISRSGDVQSDFSGDQLNVSNADAGGQMTGRVGSAGGPKITIATTYGTIHLRKTSSKQ